MGARFSYGKNYILVCVIPLNNTPAIGGVLFLFVVLLAVDPLAFLVLRVLDAPALLLRHLAVGRRLVFHLLDALLAFFQPLRFLI